MEPRRRRTGHNKGVTGGGQQAQAQQPAAAGLVAAHGDAFGIISLIGIVLIFFWRAALLRGYLFFGDIVLFFEPAKALLHESLRAGRLPLWSPWIFAGYPVAAEGQIAAFYPLSWLISWLLPAPAAINWLVIVHLTLAGVSMYVLARLLGASAFGAWLAGFTYAFSGYLFAHIHHVSLLCAASWMPLVLYFIERAWQRVLVPNAVLAAACWAAVALCGHPQTLFHISLVVLFWVGWRWRESVRMVGQAAHVRSAGVLMLTFGLGCALAAIQLLPTAALARSSPHSTIGGLAYVTSYGLSAPDLSGLVWPRQVHVLYLGLIPLGLAILGGARRRWWPLAGLAAAALLLAVSVGNPLYQVLPFLPGFSDFRAPGRYLSIFAFAAALLAAGGWSAIAELRWFQSGRRLFILGMVVVAAASFDLLRFDRTLTPLTGGAALRSANQVVDMLRKDRAWWRATIVPPTDVTSREAPREGFYGGASGWMRVRALLPADVAQSYHIRTTDGYAGFSDRTYARFLKTASAWAQSGNLDLLSLIGVRYLVLSQENLAGTKGTAAGPFVIFPNPAAFPRAFTISRTTPVRNAQEADQQLAPLARAHRLREMAVVQGEGQPMLLSSPVRSELTVSEPRPERVLIQAKSDRDCLLVLNERYDPDWRVRVDGRSSPLLNADLVLMGTLLPKGEHRVEFLYQPWTFLIGRAVSLIALVLAAAVLLVAVLRRVPGSRGWRHVSDEADRPGEIG
jgi:hypothetical protein